ncbi:MAG: repeat protein [Paenibacillaceae bacterium]|nr:repeat protein [Paenibacillaceae bacterium]
MNLRISLAKIAVSFIVLTLLFASYQIMLASGENSEPKIVMLRLEDVGPGGEYSNMDQLGKLRTVLEYLAQQGVHYQIGVIPRWVNYSEQGLTYSRSLDQLGDLYTESLVAILKSASQEGAVIGMHGFTHQVGETKRADNHQETGIGNEFNVADVPETATPAFAVQRLAEGLKIFDTVGLAPSFWETPHYHGAVAQYPVFASQFGIIYENEITQPSQTDIHLKTDTNKWSGAQTRGAAFVPTPYSYIPYNKDDKLIMDQLGKTDKLPSFFYHPFLEFKFLLPVQGEFGTQIYRNGLPEYAYPEKSKTNLQRLITNIKARGYTFRSLHDVVPFTPWSELPAGTMGSNTRLGDATGDGQADAVTWRDQGQVEVRPGSYRGKRNDSLPAATVWAQITKQKGDLFSLKDANEDGTADLWVIRAVGQLEMYLADKGKYIHSGTWKLPDLPALSAAQVLRQRSGGFSLAVVTANGAQLIPYTKQDGEWKRGEGRRGRVADYRAGQVVTDKETGADHLAYCHRTGNSCIRLEVLPGSNSWTAERTEVSLSGGMGDRQLAGDFNGDGLEDMLIWDDSDRRVSLYRQDADGSYNKLSSLGPWGLKGTRPVAVDLDGDGRTDLALLEPDGSLDTAMSFQMLE